MTVEPQSGVRNELLGRQLRMIRIRKPMRQADLAAIAGLSRTIVSRHELGDLDRSSVESLRKHAEALGTRLQLGLLGRGGDLDRLLDEEHAAIVDHLAGQLGRGGWTVEPEASYNHFGERGRYDLLAYHGDARVLLVVEVKTELADLQAMFGSLNVKERLARRVAGERGWSPRVTSTLLAIASTSAARKVAATHPNLFRAYRVHRVPTVWRPEIVASSRRNLLWIPPQATGRREWRATRRRIRPRGANSHTTVANSREG